jgi:tripartite-type tricarboxylate transporter receptor subunit TctC
MLVAALTLLVSTSMASKADEIADFYRGKSVTLMVSVAAGGGYDVWARLLGRHLGRNIPGQPNVVVQNMPGSGGLRVMNLLNTVTPRDGTAIAIVHSTAPLTPLLEPQRANFKADTYGWIGSMTRESSFCLGWHKAEVRTFADLSSKQLIVGSTGAGSHMELYPRLMNSLFGTRFKVVGGYPGGNDIYVAMESGEVEGRCGVTMPALRNVRPEWLKDRKINFIIQTGLRPESDELLKDAPVLMNLARNDTDRAVMELMFANGEFQIPVLAPPGLAPARLQGLRDAFRRTLEDPLLLEEAGRQRMDIRYVSGQDVERLITKAYATPRSIIEAATAATAAR